MAAPSNEARRRGGRRARPGEIRIRHHAFGLNFIDVYQRTGLYQLRCRWRSAWKAPASSRRWARASRTCRRATARPMPASRPALLRGARDAGQDASCKLPDAIGFDTGAAMMLKGLTVQYLLKKTLPQGGLERGRLRPVPCRGRRRRPDRLPVGKALGLQLIGTAGSDAKCALAMEHGAAHAINYTHRRLRRARQGDHRRRGREGGLRLGRQGHLRDSRSTACARSA